MAEAAVSFVLGPIIKVIVSTAASIIKDEFLSFIRIEEDIKRLSSEFSAIHAVLKDEKALIHEHWWLQELHGIAYDAADLLDNLATEAAMWKQRNRLVAAHHKFFSTISFVSDVKDILKRLSEIAEKKKRYLEANPGIVPPHGVTNRADQNQAQKDTALLDRSEVVGRKDARNKIMEMLLSDSLSEEQPITLIPITGMAGIGKTTLAQMVYNDLPLGEPFQSKMWVCVTVDYDRNRILREMMVTLDEHNYNPALPVGILETSVQSLLAGKRFLLVLDDVWSREVTHWQQLKLVLDKANKGSRVLVTSRFDKVFDLPHEHSYPLREMPDDECWSLFERKAFQNNIKIRSGSVSKQRLEDIGRVIVGKCQGLPLAVEAMGHLLNHMDPEEWEGILTSDVWQVEEQRQIIGIPARIIPALRLSFAHLPPHLKQCFAYCSIFPKAHVFAKNEMVNLWMAEAFIDQHNCKGKKIEDMGIDYFKGLLDRFFFQPSSDDKPNIYRMHDLFHDLAQSVSSSYCHQVGANDTPGEIPETCRHVSLVCTNVEQAVVEITGKCKKIRTLLFPKQFSEDFGQALEKIFSTLKYIRTLDLSSSTLENLPKSIEKLKLFRYLDLSNTEIRVLPDAICRLHNLQTLKLLKCLWLFKLPKDFSDLINLRHLELDNMFWFQCSELPPRIGRLTGLHNLHKFLVGCETGYKIEELKDLVHLTGKLHILRLEHVENAEKANLANKRTIEELVLEWSDREADLLEKIAHERTLEGLKPHSSLKELRVYRYGGTVIPKWMTDGYLGNLTFLYLRDCRNCKTFTTDGFPHLAKLCIKGMQELEEWPGENCPSLYWLTIKECPKLRNMPLFLSELQVLRIKGCDSLKILPITPSLVFGTLMNNLSFEGWSQEVTFARHQDELVPSSSESDHDQPPLSTQEQPIDGFSASYQDKLMPSSSEIEQDQPPFGTHEQPMFGIAPNNGDSLVPSSAGSKQEEISTITNIEEDELMSSTSRGEHQDQPRRQAVHTEEDQLMSIPSHQSNPEEDMSPSSQQNIRFRILQHFMLNLLELKIIGSPQARALPKLFYPQKLELSDCTSLHTLPREEHARRLQLLSLDSCPDDTLVRAIPHCPILYSLEISNIPNMVSLPILPELPKLKSLYIRGCKDLMSLLNEQDSWRLPALETLSILDCPLLPKLPDNGLPSNLRCLTVQTCPKLRSLGPSSALTSLTSLHDLYLVDCPELQSLPEEGFPGSLKHLLVRGCPLVIEQLSNEEGGVSDWQNVRGIPDLEIGAFARKTQASSSGFGACRYFACCKGISPDEKE